MIRDSKQKTIFMIGALLVVAVFAGTLFFGGLDSSFSVSSLDSITGHVVFSPSTKTFTHSDNFMQLGNDYTTSGSVNFWVDPSTNTLIANGTATGPGPTVAILTANHNMSGVADLYTYIDVNITNDTLVGSNSTQLVIEVADEGGNPHVDCALFYNNTGFFLSMSNMTTDPTYIPVPTNNGTLNLSITMNGVNCSFMYSGGVVSDSWAEPTGSQVMMLKLVSDLVEVGEMWNEFKNFEWVYTVPSVNTLQSTFDEPFNGIWFNTMSYRVSETPPDTFILSNNKMEAILSDAPSASFVYLATNDRANISQNFNMSVDINISSASVNNTIFAELGILPDAGGLYGCQVTYNGSNYDLVGTNTTGGGESVPVSTGVGILYFEYDAVNMIIDCQFDGEAAPAEQDLVEGFPFFEAVGGPGEDATITFDNWVFSYFDPAPPPAPTTPLGEFYERFTGVTLNGTRFANGTSLGLDFTQNDNFVITGTATEASAVVELFTNDNVNITADFNSTVTVNLTGSNLTSRTEFALYVGPSGTSNKTGCLLRLNDTGGYTLCTQAGTSKSCSGGAVTTGVGELVFNWVRSTKTITCVFDGVTKTKIESFPQDGPLKVELVGDDAGDIVTAVVDDLLFDTVPYGNLDWSANEGWEEVSCGTLYSTQATCEGDTSCQWEDNDLGSSCVSKGCWDLYTQTDCDGGSGCQWTSGWSSGWCEQTMCSSFDGTNESWCETNNPESLTCNWQSACYGFNAGSDCYSISDSTTCEGTSGCNWGRCDQLDCWSYGTENACDGSNSSNGNACSWNSEGSYCVEAGCSTYSGTDQNTCQSNAAGISCVWVDDYYNYQSCEEPSCWQYDFSSEANCVNNSLNLSCTWAGSYCYEAGCSNFGEEGTCEVETGCTWRASEGAGWCEQLNCWQYDATSQQTCESNAAGLQCTWNNGWCDSDTSWSGYSGYNSNCSSMTSEYDCMETYYCWWDFAGQVCNDPSEGIDHHFVEWNPGCYMFDSNQTNCELVEGCQYSGSICETNSSHAYSSTIDSSGLNCSMMGGSTLCGGVSILSSCCEWSAGSCHQNKFSTACWDNIDELPGGYDIKACKEVGMYASDADSAETLCNQISNDPWYFPCSWNGTVNECQFKTTNVFGENTQNVALINNQKNCESAGGKWVKEKYCEGTTSVPTGRCEMKFGTEVTDCNSRCFACEYDEDGQAHADAATAEDYCEDSALGYCAFTSDTTAPNGFGFCGAKDEMKQGLGGDCKTDCGSCTYLGDVFASSEYDGSTKSYETCNTPECYCEQAYEFSSVKCKWVGDTTSDYGGYCLDSSAKTCNDACDRCETQDDCANNGRVAIVGSTGSCIWEGQENDGSCVKAGEDSEICWDAEDNNNDNLIDCDDPQCYSDSFCGFVTGDCFGWSTQNDCTTNDCEWITDPWGSWCDFAGAGCWKLDGNETGCQADNNCEWDSGSGAGWCEQNWSVGEDCYTQTNSTACAGTPDCSWTNDTWCSSADGAASDWCDTQAGWCDPSSFQSNDCWLYDSNSTACGETSGCNYQQNDWGSACEVDWSANCWMFGDSNTCETGGCSWLTSGEYSWCENSFGACWSNSDSASCSTDSNCQWSSWSNMCEPICYDLDDASCEGTSGCVLQSGWCMEDWTQGGVDCWNSTLSVNQNDCNAEADCSWKNPGWCNPTGFGGGSTIGGVGGGVSGGMECWKYDGTNETWCEGGNDNSLDCSWMQENWGFCEPDWSSECWIYDWNATICSETSGCAWNTQGNYCMNMFDQCWSNSTLNSDENACNTHDACNWSGSWCEPSCFSATTEGACTGSCRWINGWCNDPGMFKMFDGMEQGAPVSVAWDDCNSEISQGHMDLCDAGMKDMDDSFGFGARVADFSQVGVCNQQKVDGIFGNGNEDVKFYVYLDTDGVQTGGCSLENDETQVGYEFMLKYKAEWNATASKASNKFNAYKCSSGTWKATDIGLDTWKEKMCSEIGGPMVAVQKSDLEKFPSLYDSGVDMRVYVAIANATGNAEVPTDTAGPGWVTPGAIDFQINNFFSYDADNAMSEDILKNGYVKYEDCYNTVDDDDDDLVDCNDWDCQYASHCDGLGVNADSYVDTSMPSITGVKIEEYPDAAMIMYDTSKPTNGTLSFWYDDSTCTSSSYNRTIFDRGVWSDSMRTHKLWHYAKIYDDGGVHSLDYNLSADTNYYYKLKICDSDNKCSQSACTKFHTTTTTNCGYCDFVTKISAPTGWTVSYDLDQDGTYEHEQGAVCGTDAGMLVNYTTGRAANVKLADGGDAAGYIEFLNVTISKLGLTTTTRELTNETLISNNSLTDASGALVGVVGMGSQTRDKIVNNLHPDRCVLRIPSDGTCDELWHCDDDGGNCVQESGATLIETQAAHCVWDIPYCEFSTWASGEPETTLSEAAESSSGGAAGSTAGGVVSDDDEVVEEEEETVVEDEKPKQKKERPFKRFKDKIKKFAGEAIDSPGEYWWLWLSIAALLIAIALVIYFFHHK